MTPSGEKDEEPDPLDRTRAEALLHDNTYPLFGPRSAERHVFIMVTAPDAAQVTPKWATEVIRAGAHVLRINGAHESPAEWSAIAGTFKARAAAEGKQGRIFVDLPGPKLRAEIRTLEDAVILLPRRKDHLGRTVAPTEVLLVGEHRGGTEVPVPPGWLDRPGLPLEWRRGGSVKGSGEIGRLPCHPKALELSPGTPFCSMRVGEATTRRSRCSRSRSLRFSSRCSQASA